MKNPLKHLPSIHLNLRLLCLAVLSIFLAACSSAVPEANIFEQPRDSHLITVPLDHSISDLEAQYDGTIITTNDTHAVLSVNLSTEAFSTLGVKAELDTASFVAGAQSSISGHSTAWAGGHSTAWAGGHSTAWAGGHSTAWAGGEFTWLPENTKTWQQINLEKGQNLTQNLGFGIKVAIIDTGVDLLHPALIEALAPESEWYDFVDDDAMPQEEGVLSEGGYGHGTNVAGIVRQIAPRATILPIRALGPDGSGFISDLVKAIHYAVDQGADVINLSLGSANYSKSVDVALSYANQSGVLVVASSGNSANWKVTYPAAASSYYGTDGMRLSVTSVDAQDNKSSFANYGYYVELAAPGENIYGPAPDLRLAAWSGTSMAAPIATGMLALALGESPKLEVDQLEKMIRVSASDLYDNQNMDYSIGDGRVDVAAFITAVLQ